MASSGHFKINNLSIQFGGLKAVTGFSLDLPPNSLYGLIGPNGAGKTTVFNLITGVYRPNTGTIHLDDKSLLGLKPYHIGKAGLSRTFQNIRLFKDLTVLQNVMISFHMRLNYHWWNWLFADRKFQEIEKGWQDHALKLLDLLRLSHRKDDVAKNLSYGNQRRLEIARALATEPKVLFLDEPAAGLHSQEKTELMHTIALIRKNFNLSILLIEHDMKLVMGICEKIVVLDHGEVIAFGTAKEIQHNPKVIEAYLGVA